MDPFYELKVYFESDDFKNNHMREIAGLESLRWLFFSIGAVLASLFCTRETKKIVRISSSKNQSRSMQEALGHDFHEYRMFSTVRDGASFSEFYCNLLAKLPEIISRIAFSRCSPADEVVALFETMTGSWRVLFEKNSIERVEISNDHLFYFRALVTAAAVSGVEVVYVQHGQVTKNFPHLRHFSRIYLWDKMSLEMYGEDTVQPGSVCFYKASRKEIAPLVEPLKVLVCINSPADIQALKRVLDEAVRNDSIEDITVRYHVYVSSNDLQFTLSYDNVKLESAHGVQFSQAIRGYDLCVGGNSSVLGESIREGVPAAYFHFSGEHDYYSMLKQRQVPEILSLDFFSIEYVKHFYRR